MAAAVLSRWSGSRALRAALPDATPSDDGRTGGQTALGFESDEDPEAVAARLIEAGFADAIVLDENFGHSVRVTGPDGTAVQINFSDRSLYA
jgi:hypothetical protein